MLRINVLDRLVRLPLPRASPFWYPVHLNRRYLKAIGLKFDFFGDMDESIVDCDVLFLSSRYFHLEGQAPSGKSRILETLTNLKAKISRLIWFDLRDSTGNTQFDVLPYVTKYLKKQLLKERELYREELYGNRVYTDYFHKAFGINDAYVEECTALPEGEASKLDVSWNVGMHDNRGGGVLGKVGYFFMDQVEAFSRGEHRIPWQSCSAKRDVNMVALFQTDYERNTVAFQRVRAAGILGGLRDPDIVTGTRLRRRRYLNLIGRAKVVLSLFGWGEICFRDFEAFIAGAALLMPDISHVETWPDVHVPYVTYWPLKWDLSDLVESYRRLTSDESVRMDLAQAGQDRYRGVWSGEGRERFCERLRGIVESASDER